MSRSSTTDKVSISTLHNHITSPPSSHTTSRTSSAGGARLSSSSVVRRGSSLGSGGRLGSSSGSHRTSGRYTRTGSSNQKLVYSPTTGHSGGGGTTRSQRAPSPGGRKSVSVGSVGWPSSSSQPGRTNSARGRVISSSDPPIRSTGSRAGGHKERISVCKMAALSMSAVGRERSQKGQRQQAAGEQATNPENPSEVTEVLQRVNLLSFQTRHSCSDG